MFSQGNDVFRTLAQRRNAELELAEAMKKILAKAAFFDRSFEILIGGGDDADIDFDFAVAAETVERLAIQHAQKLDLSLQLQFADFVEKKSTFVGQFEEARFRNIGAAEGAFFVSEEFALHQILGKRGAVDVDPGTAAAMGRLVNRARDQFLASTSLAGNQNSFRMPGDAVHQAHELVHDRTGENEVRVIDFAGNHAGRKSGRGSAGLLAVTLALACGTTTATTADRLRSRITKKCGGKLHGKAGAGLGPGKQVGSDSLLVAGTVRIASPHRGDLHRLFFPWRQRA